MQLRCQKGALTKMHKLGYYKLSTLRENESFEKK